MNNYTQKSIFNIRELDAKNVTDEYPTYDKLTETFMNAKQINQ